MPGLITGRTTVREAVTRYPGAEKIFDKYGLTGCGGPDGPVEPVGFFAAVHHVDPQQLIAELDAYAASQTGRAAAGEPGGEARETARMDGGAGAHYPLFLMTSLAIALVVGVTSGIAAAMTGGGWGALRGASWLALVQTHGHVQVFGYLGLFVMGIAYHVLPRFKGQPPPGRRIVLGSYALMLSGVTLRMLAQPHGQGFLRWMLGASAPLELVGAAVFAWYVARVFWRARDKREGFDRYVLVGAGWFVIALAMNAYLVVRAAVRGERLLPAAGDAALLEAVVYGFVVFFVLGVSFRALPFFLSLRPVHTRLRDAAFWVLLLAAPLRVAATWAPQFTAAAWPRDAMYASTFALALAVVAAVVALRVFEPADGEAPPVEAPPAYRPMVQVAYAWLLVGVSLDVYWRLRELDGGYTPMYAAGAIRHAFLLGFATLMIMAMAYRVVPVFSGRALRWPGLVPASFGLVGAAAVLRVAPVALTLAPSPLDFKLLTAAGVLLFFGLAVFAAELATAMYARFAAPAAVVVEPVEAAAPEAGAAEETPAPVGAAPEPARGDGPVYADMTVAEALRLGPIVLQVLLDFGFGPLADPEMRARMAPTITVARAAAFVGAKADVLVDTLNAAVAADPGRRADGVAPVECTLIETTVTREQVLDALRRVYDPEIPVNIVDLGLVYGIVVRDAYAHLTMTLTAPGCPVADQVEADVRAALESVPGVETVDVDIVEEPAWSPARMSAAARAALGWSAA